MPFAGFSNWEDCIKEQIKKGKSKESAEKICGKLKDKYENKTEIKSYSFTSEPMNYEVVETKEGKKYYISGYISTYDRDLVNDIVTPTCMKDMLDQLQRRPIKMDLEHEAFTGDSHIEKEVAKTKIPIGKIVEGRLDNKGLFVKTQLNSNHHRFKEAWNSIKEGFLDAFSIAYVPIKTAVKEVDGVVSRLLDKVNLLNVAYTGNPCNPTATMAEVFTKSLNDINIGEDKMASEDVKEKEVKEEEEKPTEEETPETPEEENKEEMTEVKALRKEVSELKEMIKEIKEESEGEEETPEEPQEENNEMAEIKEQLEEIKKQLDKPQYKSQQENMNESLSNAEEEVKSKGPLDYIN